MKKKAARTGFTSKTETITAKRVSTRVSVKNWYTIFVLLLPNTFRTPISFARCTDCAVDKLIKLTAAINRINKASPINAYKTGIYAFGNYRHHRPGENFCKMNIG